MSEPIFYSPDCNENTALQFLPEDESQHAVKVLRLQKDQPVVVVNGVGGYFHARITNPHHKRCEFEILDVIQQYGKRNYRIHIAIAPTKNMDRIEWFVEKATEIGIDEITPVICRFSERKVLKEERLDRIIVSASKQSQKAYFPVLHETCTFKEFMQNEMEGLRFIAHCYDEEKKLLKNEIVKGEKVTILIGPEGDFSTEEVELALAKGFVPVSLGDNRLRTETAGLVACHTVALMNQ